MAIVGHPRFAGGYDTILPGDGGNNTARFPKDLGALSSIVMAGDTHEFEYYRVRDDIHVASASVAHHFVNGGGGAYLSIGTALGFPKSPPVADWAIYPRTDKPAR